MISPERAEAIWRLMEIRSPNSLAAQVLHQSDELEILRAAIGDCQCAACELLRDPVKMAKAVESLTGPTAS